MNKENVSKWIEALRSGKYKQCKWVLKCESSIGEEKFCAIGLACEVFDNSKWLRVGGGLFNYDNVQSTVEWLNTDLAHINDVRHMNDSGESFDSIANFLENLLKEDTE